LKTNSATSIDSFRPWHFFVLAGFIAATAAALLAGRTSPSHLVLLSIAILGAALTAAGLHRTIAPLAAPHTFESTESLGRRTRAALEREKALVLRSIKELEFDRAMGKVSDRDFQEMAGRLKGRAIELIKRLDADVGGHREIIEREIATRLEATPIPRECGVCETTDADARFCKRCGAKL
jgi:hypothetical protein